jgi:GT2 family glycosyltransferase
MDSPYANKDIILVDNASTDGSSVPPPLFPRVLILECVKSLGITGARNRGFREAVGRGNDYVFSLDHDAHIDARLLDDLVAVAGSDPRPLGWTAQTPSMRPPTGARRKYLQTTPA